MEDQPACTLNSLSPIFIVDDIRDTVDFYTEKLGFQELYKAEDEEGLVFFAMMSRGGISLMFKKIAPEVHPRSISQLAVEDTAIFDAFWHVSHPHLLLDEFQGKGVKIVRELTTTTYGTQEFAFEDLNGYQFLCGN